MQSARIRPSPYTVKQLKHSDIHIFTHAFINSIRPEKKPGDHTVFDLRGLKYSTEGVCFKQQLTDSVDWQELPQRVYPFQRQHLETMWRRLFESRLPIKTRKFIDLQAMKSVIAQEAHCFFDHLPHA